MDAMRGVLVGGVEDMARLGKNLAIGIGRGMQDAEDTLLRVLDSILNALIAVGLKALGIASPSRLTMDWGRNLVDGMAIGIEGQRDRLRSAWQETLGLIEAPGINLSAGLSGLAVGPGQAAVASQAPPEGRPLTVRLDGPAIPPPTNPLAAARDRQWQAFWRNSALIAEEDGFRGLSGFR